MKINFNILKYYRKVKSSFQLKNKYYADGKPATLCHKGIMAHFYSDGKIDSLKTHHEFIRFGYTQEGDRYVKLYRSEPNLLFKGKYKALFEKYMLKK